MTAPQPTRQNTQGASFQMSDKEFETLRSLIFDTIGITIKAHKKYLLVNRLSKRLRHLGLRTFTEYLGYLESCDQKYQELTELIDAVTTNKTDFYREPKHYTVLEDMVLPAIMNDSRKKDRTIRIWSSACSSGEEPYTLGIIMSEYLKKHSGWKVEILASDISETVLRAAVTGIYEQPKIAPIPYELLRKYFLKGNARYKVTPELARLVTFKKVNLKTDYPRAIPTQDIVFCRNVLIYFEPEHQKDIIAKHWQVLQPNGFLFLGHSETLHGGSGSYSYVAPSVYQKTSQAPN